MGFINTKAAWQCCGTSNVLGLLMQELVHQGLGLCCDLLLQTSQHSEVPLQQPLVPGTVSSSQDL